MMKVTSRLPLRRKHPHHEVEFGLTWTDTSLELIPSRSSHVRPGHHIGYLILFVTTCDCFELWVFLLHILVCISLTSA